MKLLLVVMVAISLLCGVAFGQMNPASKGDAKETGLTMKGTTFVSGVSIPNTISYQGLLNTSSGYPVSDGSFELKFELFDVSVGGSAIWSETHSAVTVGRGTFSILLGSITPFGPIFFQPLWVEVTAVSGPGISSPVLFSPRTQLASAAYSLGPWQSVAGDYYIPDGNIGVGGPPTWPYRTIELFDSTTSAWFVAKSLSNYAGIAIDKPFDYYNGYVALLTNGVWKWSVGTKGSDDFSIFNWTAYQEYFHIDSLGNVGIGISAPTKKLDVNGAVQIEDSLFVGSPTQNGIVNIYRNGSNEPIVKTEDWFGYGGQMTLQDELGNPIVYMRPNGNGEGGGIQVYRTTSQVGFEAWGDWYGLGEGYVGIYGANRSIIFEPRFAGDASVQLPDSSISSAEILDEPGISNSQSTAFRSNSTSGTVIAVDSVDITVPAAGYIDVTGGAWLNINHVTGTNTEVWLGINNAGAAQSTYPGLGVVRLPAALPTNVTAYGYPGTTSRFYSVSAGTYRYYLNLRFAGAGTYAEAGMPHIRAIYYPTLYGTSSVISPTAYFNPDSKTDGSEQINIEQIKITPEEHLQQLKAKAAQLKSELESTIKQLENVDGSQNGSQR